MQLQHACDYMLNRLARELDSRLTYHNLAHTTDVMAQTARIAQAEGITNPTQLALLQTAACYHDSGFLNVYDQHEAEGCRIATDTLPRFGYSPAQINTICRLISATKIPQSPTDKLGEILCDADLDYLGRSDYSTISGHLLTEWLAFDRIPDPAQWGAIQRNFLSQHRYFTATNRRLRSHSKQQVLVSVG
ncbi:HD domain-containing protein [Fibrella aquatilis]|uniref:HD domain-containing protein n=1 Tax=Fibrella aquatilis TaxID=2817059 RepID=A0A939GA32_9BACT|nr:HD domain-containing protein [Fibrella aquatilis]MBO0932568.1 HD domain-containing protein [Fibrella aquatilis]